MLATAFLALTTSLVWAHPQAFEQMGVVAPKTVKPAPDFALTDIHGKPVSLGDFRGKTVLLNFWATWCGACKEELPSMERLYQSLKGKGFEIVAISIDRGNQDRVKKYAREYNLSFPILLDPDQKIRKNYYIMGLPTSYLIDPQGQLRGFVSGARTWDHPLSKEIMMSFKNSSAVVKKSRFDND